MHKPETQIFTANEGTSAMFFDIEQTGRGATVDVERTEERGWKSTARFDDAKRLEFFGMLNLKGFQGYHTGGGCRAMASHFGESGNVYQILVTDSDADMPEPQGAWMVGAHDPDGDCFDFQEGTGDEALAAAIDVAIAAVEARRASETDETRAKRDAEHAALLAQFNR